MRQWMLLLAGWAALLAPCAAASPARMLRSRPWQMLAGGQRRSAAAKRPAKQPPRPVFGVGSPRWKHKKLRDAEAEGDDGLESDLLEPGDPSHTARGGGGGSRGGGRSRSAKREELYVQLSAYSAHFSALLKCEWGAEQEALQAEICDWPLDKLKKAGLLLDRLCVRRIEELYGSPVLRLSLRPPPAGPRSQRGAGEAAPSAPVLPYHAFSVGDAVSLCVGSSPVLPIGHPRRAGGGRRANDSAEGGGRRMHGRENLTFEGGGFAEHSENGPVPVGKSLANSGEGRVPENKGWRADSGGDGEDPIPGVLLQRTDSIILVVIPRLPSDRLTALQTASGLCLYRGASAIPFERNQAAVDSISDPSFPEAGMHPDLREIILRGAPLDIRPPQFFPSRRGERRPAEFDAPLPPSPSSPPSVQLGGAANRAGPPPPPSPSRRGELSKSSQSAPFPPPPAVSHAVNTASQAMNNAVNMASQAVNQQLAGAGGRPSYLDASTGRAQVRAAVAAVVASSSGPPLNPSQVTAYPHLVHTYTYAHTYDTSNLES
jgi:hypothetical protein